MCYLSCFGIAKISNMRKWVANQMFPYRYPAGKAMSLLLMCENWKKNDITAQCMIERREKDSFKCLDSSQFCLRAVRVGFLVQKVVTFQMYVEVFMRRMYKKEIQSKLRIHVYLNHTLSPNVSNNLLIPMKQETFNFSSLNIFVLILIILKNYFI